jgi:hypothetical protein
MATTTLKTSSLPWEFVFNGSRIPDSDPQMSWTRSATCLRLRALKLRLLRLPETVAPENIEYLPDKREIAPKLD